MLCFITRIRFCSPNLHQLPTSTFTNFGTPSNWTSAKNLSLACFTLDKSQWTKILFVPFLILPELGPDEQYHPVPNEEGLITFLRDIGYDESEEVVTRHSKVNTRFLPQPWRTLYILIAKSLSGRDVGHEHPKLQHLKLFWAMVNVKLVDYASIIWEDIVWHIQHKSAKIPFVRFTKLLIQSFLNEFDDSPQRLDDTDKHTFINEPTLKHLKRLDTSTRKEGMELPECLLTAKVKSCKNYKYYVQALKENKVGFLDEVPLPSSMQKKGKKGGKSGSSESSTKYVQKPHKRSLKIRIPIKKTTLVPEALPEPLHHLLHNHLIQRLNQIAVRCTKKLILVPSKMMIKTCLMRIGIKISMHLLKNLKIQQPSFKDH
jgi:hypothetical protein